jgi:hypothetical protein
VRTRTVWKFAANPFVVMTDITIALAFVMFGYYLANADSFAKFRARVERLEEQRDARLVSAAQRLAEEVAKQLGPDYVVDSYQAVRNGRVEWVPTSKGSAARNSIVALVGQLGEPPFLQIDRNETLMRLRLYGLEFERGSDRFVRPQEARMILGIVTSQMRQALIGTAYLYIHGISSESDANEEPKRLELSRKRADRVHEILRSLGLVLDRDVSQGEIASQQGSGETGPYLGSPTYYRRYDGTIAILPSFVIPYGTGTRLYTDPWRVMVSPNGGGSNLQVAPKGRVDLVFFFRTPKVMAP